MTQRPYRSGETGNLHIVYEGAKGWKTIDTDLGGMWNGRDFLLPIQAGSKQEARAIIAAIILNVTTGERNDHGADETSVR